MPDETATPPEAGRRPVGAVEDTLRSAKQGDCFTDDGAAAYLSGGLDDSVRDVMRAHLDTCEACRTLVLYAARGMGSGVDVAADTAPFAKDGDEPHRIGRFTILEKIGAGGMGVVYSAFDGELDRKVALKLVRTELRDEKPEATRQAMAREAKAMAKVDHPNVITVFEVGTHEDHIFVAMELVVGGDLRSWLAAAPRTWRDKLAVCRQAGLGLAAAHNAGLVHRDFKPDNVLVGADGRVRVTDFGLARAVDEAGARPSYVALAAPALRPSDRLTRTGALVGTPAYMAPEQHRGEPADARSDQFAFCVTVWELLFGARPFAGTTFPDIVANVAAGTITEPAESDVPVRIREALRRGLRTDPAERFPTMDALLDELVVETRKKRAWWALAAVPLVAAAGVAIWVASRADDSEAACPTAESRLAGVWDAKRRADTSAAMRGVGPFGVEMAARTIGALDAYTQSWTTSWNAACAASAAGEQSPTMFDLRVACLMRRLHSVDALANALAKGDPAVIAKAGALVEGLAPVEACNNTESLARAAPPPAILLEVRAIEEMLEKAHGLRMSGEITRARELATEALANAERIAYKPSQAAALLTLARVEHDEGDYAEAEKFLQRASTAAMSSNSDELAADILTELADLVGYDLARPAEAYRLVEIARGAIERIGSPPLARILLLSTQSRIAMADGKPDAAIAAVDEATKIANQIGEEMQLIPLVAVRQLVLLDQGKFSEAMSAIDEELALRAKHEGTKHPNYAQALESRSTLHFTMNAWDEGLADLARAKKIKVDALGADSPELLSTENNIGMIAALFADYDEALRSAELVLAIAKKRHGMDHPTTALALSNLGATLVEMGRIEDGSPYLDQSLALREKLLGKDHPDYAVSLTEQGELRLAQKRPKEAIEYMREAERVLVAAIGEQSPLIPYATYPLGVAQAQLGDTRAAKATLERTLARLDELGLDPVLNARTRLALADVLWKLGERVAAKRIAAEAPGVLEKLPARANKELRTQIAAWIAKHR